VAPGILPAAFPKAKARRPAGKMPAPQNPVSLFTELRVVAPNYLFLMTFLRLFVQTVCGQLCAVRPRSGAEWNWSR